jgi:isopenicillin N synthase-like dioxygenase
MQSYGKARRTRFREIPFIDLTPMSGTETAAKAALGRRLRDVCSTVGFFYLTGHAVPQETIDRFFAIGKRFMALPEAEKIKASIDRHPNRYSGYSPLRSRGGALFAAYDMTVEFPPDHPAVVAGLLQPCANIWPEGFAEFEATFREYRGLMLDLGRRLFGAFALALDLPEDHFAGIAEDPFGSLRLAYYPPQDPRTEDTDVGIHTHTDYQCFTMVAQDGVPGLEVQNGAGEWVTAPPVPGTFVVNIGDLLARWTNDIFTSTPHRVLNLTGEERMSIPFFFGTDFMVPIDTLPSCITPERPRHYEPVVSGPYVLEQFAAFKKGPPQLARREVRA